MEYTYQQRMEIERIVDQIRAIESIIGKKRARKTTISTLKKLPLDPEQRDEIIAILGYKEENT